MPTLEKSNQIMLVRGARRDGDLHSIVEKLDGLGMNFENWRFNLRMSNTEPVVRLNIEARADPELLATKTQELIAMID